MSLYWGREGGIYGWVLDVGTYLHNYNGQLLVLFLQEYVCGDKGVNCSWGQAINVANRYVYVSQPTKDRVLVISKIQMVVVDVSTS